MTRNRAILSGTLVLAVFVALLLWIRAPQGMTRAGIRAALETASNALHEPGRTVDAAAPALGTPQAAAEFIAENVREASYSGHVFAPETVLQLRVGNRLDRAILLAALIKAQGGDAQVMRSDTIVDVMPWQAGQLPDEYGALLDYLEVERREHAKTHIAEMTAEAERLSQEVTRAAAFLADRMPPFVSGAESQETQRQAWVIGTDAEGAAFAYDPADPDGMPPQGGEVFEGEPQVMTIRLIARDRDGGSHILLEHRAPVQPDMALSFQPVISPIDAFGRAPDPANVAVWMPTITLADKVVSGRPFTPSGDLPPTGADSAAPLLPSGTQTRPAVQIDELALRQISIGGARIPRLSVAAKVPSQDVLSALDFALTDGGEAVLPRVVALPQDEFTGRPVVMMIDASASMARGERIFASREIAQALLEQLPDETAFAVVSMAFPKGPITRELAPLSGTRAEAQEALDAAYMINDGITLSEALNTLLPTLTEPVDIILIGDGQLIDEDITPDAERLAVQNIRMFSIAIDAATEEYLPLGPAWRWNPSDTPADTINSLLANRSPYFALDWTTPDTATAGEMREVILTARRGTAQPIVASYVVPDDATPPQPLLSQLDLEVTLPGAEEPIVKTREVLSFAKSASPWQLETQARLMFSPTPSPAPVIIAAYLDAWIGLMDAQDAADAGEALPDQPGGPNFAGLQRVSSIKGLAELASGGDLQTNSVMAVMERLDVAPDDAGTVRLTRTLDVIADGGLARGTQGSAPWIAGLALGAAEASLISAKSVNTQLLTGDGAMLINATDPLPEWARTPMRDAAQVAGTTFVVSGAAQDVTWIIAPSGELQARLFSPDSKGASAREIAEVFRVARNRLEVVSILSGAAGSVVGLSGIAHGGIIGLLDQNMRMWCFSSVMMGYVGDAIGGLPTPGEGDPAVWEARALALCELADPDGLARAYVAAIGSGMISGYIGDVLGGLSGRAFSDGLGRQLSNVEDFANAGFWNSVVSTSGIGPVLQRQIGDRIAP